MALDPQTEKASEKMMDLATGAMQHGLMALGDDANVSQATYIAAVGVAASLHIAATVLGRCEKCEGSDDHSPLDHVNPVALLFGALLAVEACGDRTLQDKPGQVGMAFEFGPDIILSALQKTETILGRKPDEFLCKPMIDTVRGIEKEHSGNLDVFLAQRQSERGSKH